MQNGNRRILIVDDEAPIRNLLLTAFESAGYDVTIAADGLAAKAICTSESFDAVLCDVRMPGMNGHELVRWIAMLHPRTRFVLMSGFDDIQCEGCGVAVPPCSLLPKPFRPSEAIALIGRILDSGERNESPLLDFGTRL